LPYFKDIINEKNNISIAKQHTQAHEVEKSR
jgi:hypothetical protein